MSANSAARGFSAPSRHLYHAHPPTGWSAWEGEHAPARLRFDEARAICQLALAGARQFCIMHICACGYGARQGKMDHLVCNADGDELLFVHSGEGDLFCDFGHLILPRRRLYRPAARHALARGMRAAGQFSC